MTYHYRHISFESMHPGLSVRALGDSNCMMVLDLLSVLAGGDRKKASQTLARVSSRQETAELLTLRHHHNHNHHCTGAKSNNNKNNKKKNPRKLISFANAIQLLLMLPKRTVDLQTRRTVAGILADYFEASATTTAVTPSSSSSSQAAAGTTTTTMKMMMMMDNNDNNDGDTTTTNTTTSSSNSSSSDENNNTNNNNNASSSSSTTAAPKQKIIITPESLALNQTLLQIEQQALDNEQRRRLQPLENLRQCLDLLLQCGPLSEGEQKEFRRAIAVHMPSSSSRKVY